jgi:sulfur-oxidizing protein SoxY
MNPLRRILLRTLGASLVVAAGWLRPLRALAAEWNKAGFEAKSVADALKSIGAATSTESQSIVIKAPEIAENGAVVPVEVTSKIPNTRSISILADKNPFPLIASFDLMDGAEGFVSTRVKLGQTSQIRAIVKADGKVYSATKEVKVTIGGCGGG